MSRLGRIPGRTAAFPPATARTDVPQQRRPGRVQRFAARSEEETRSNRHDRALNPSSNHYQDLYHKVSAFHPSQAFAEGKD